MALCLNSTLTLNAVTTIAAGNYQVVITNVAGSVTSSVAAGPNTETDRVQHDAWYYVRSRNGQIHAKVYLFMNTYWDERGVPFLIGTELVKRAVVRVPTEREHQLDHMRLRQGDCRACCQHPWV